ncbi:hypothetical protein GCM10008090_06520 [Arenicella chitinivorans]|uniref:Sulfotransferase family protein n=1 Tax=Arenicella chitinivorans TaxID=1329800 RepID=A0A918VIN0_9GAMM|nr:sulfotransferase family 2 domain-containing protein [Arenicella chitinivorans]GHA00441.1 hypothetical protein GCM10008090_06520 [Arenicella chitinivorans]
MSHTPIPARLICIHIEKTAGNSFRTLAYQNYGRENVFWSGIDSRQPIVREQDLTDYTVVGGHWSMHHYKSHNATNLYCSLLREPIKRMKSLFHFTRTRMDPAGQKKWQEFGFDPDSLSMTLRQSPKFISMIKNRQCQMLTGQQSYVDAKRVMENGNFIVGTLDDHAEYITELARQLGWQHTALPHKNKSDTPYQDDIQIDEDLAPLVEELCAQDQLLYNAIKQRTVYTQVNQELAKRLAPEPLEEALTPQSISA